MPEYRLTYWRAAARRGRLAARQGDDLIDLQGVVGAFSRLRGPEYSVYLIAAYDREKADVYSWQWSRLAEETVQALRNPWGAGDFILRG